MRLLFLILLWAPVVSAQIVADPTRPPWISGAVSGVRQESPVVAAILVNGSRRLCVCNGHILAVGSRLAGGRIIRIRHNGVLIAGPFGHRLLPLGGDNTGMVNKIPWVGAGSS